MADINAEELAKALTAATIAAAEHERAIASNNNAMNAYSVAVKQAVDESEAASKKLNDALKSNSLALGKSAVEFGKAMATGGEGTAKYSGAVTGATDAVGNAAAAFGPLGMIVGGVVKAFGALMGASLKQNDQLMRSYRQLADVGSVSGSLEKLQEDLNKVGLTSKSAEDIEKFGKLIGDNAASLANFGGSVTAGRDKFIDVFKSMIGVGNKTEIAMQRIGYSADDMRDATANYISQQTKLGLVQGKSSGQLRNESEKYMTTLRELSELTGVSRDEAQRIRQDQINDARYARHLNELALIDPEQAKRLQDYTTAFEAVNGKKAVSGLIEQIVNAGDLVGEASIRSYQSTMGQGHVLAMEVQKNGMSIAKALSLTSNAVNKNIDQFNPAFMVLGSALDQLTGGAEIANASLQMKGKSEVEITKMIAKSQQERDDRLNKNIIIEQKDRAVRIAADKALMEVGNATVSMFEKLNDIMFKFGKFLAQMVDKFSSVIPGMKQTNLAFGFKDKDDFENDLKIARTEKILAEQKARQITKDYEDIANDRTQTGKVLRQKIERLEEQIRDTKPENITGALGRGVVRKPGQDSLVEKNKLAKAQLEELKILEKELATVKDKEKNVQLDKLNLLRDRELLKVKEQNEQANKKILDAEKNLTNFSAVDKNGVSSKPQESDQSSAESKRLSSVGTKSLEQLLSFGNKSGSKSNFEALDESIKQRVIAAAKEYNAATGKQIQINSAKRNPEDQQKLWDESEKAGRPGISPTGMPIAKPGTSKHEHGKAIDIQNYNDPEAVKAMNNQGLYQTVPGDDVHFTLPQARTGGAFSGPNNGYPVELHGKNESVWPEEKLKSVLAEVQKSSIEDYKKELLSDMKMNKSSPDIANTSTSSDNSTNRMMEMLTAKFDNMINQLETSNSTLNNLLTYAKA